LEPTLRIGRSITSRPRCDHQRIEFSLRITKTSRARKRLAMRPHLSSA